LTKTQSRQGIIKSKKHAKRVKIGLLVVVIINGLASNLSASANGTSRPDKEGLLGPRRSIIYPKTLRSIKVKKATETNKSKSETIDTTS